MAEVPLPTPTDNPVPSTDIRDAVYAGAMLDKVVTSTDLTYTDRLGGEHYTVDGIKAEGDKVVEETRQNLIPLSRQYMTLAAAQADIANIPTGSATYYRSPDDSALAIEVINNAGTLTATGRKMPAYSSLRRGNILFDAFNEYSSSLLTFANWDWYKGATPTFSTTDVNLPLPTPVIQASGVTSFDKYYDVSKLQVKPGDTLAFSVLVWFENTGGKLQIYWLDSAGAAITTGEASPLVAGISSPVVVIAVPSGASSIRIRVQNTVSGAFKIGAYAAAIGDVSPEFTRSFPSKSYQEALGTPDNLVYDPFGEMLAVRPKQGLPAGVVDATSYAGTLIPNSANSPWGKTGIQNTSGVGADRIISLSSMGVKPGDTITVRLAAWFASTGGTFQVFCRMHPEHFLRQLLPHQHPALMMEVPR